MIRPLQRLFVGVSLRPGLLLIPMAVALLLVPDSAVARQMQEGSIVGRVTDESGAVLPGVTVSVSGPALLVAEMSDVTNAQGEYRLTPLPLGTYAVQFALAGFQTVRHESVRLTAGFAAKVDVVLMLGAVEESVTVSGLSPVVDVKNTTAGTQITREVLDSVPTGRSGIASLLTLGAGVRPQPDFGMNITTPFFRAFGRSNNGWVLVDGIAVTAPYSQASGSILYVFNYGNVEEASIQTLGSSAESPTSGIQLSVITKSGGNDFHGGGYLNQFAHWMQSSNVDDQLRAQGITAPSEVLERWDRSAELGGRLVRNRLWFYGTGRFRTDQPAILGLFTPDGSPAVNGVDQKFFVTKISGQLTPSQRLVGAYHWTSHINEGGSTFNRFNDFDSRGVNGKKMNTGKIEWQLAKNDRFLSLQYGVYDNVGGPVTGFTNQPSTIDQVTSRITGVSSAAGQVQNDQRYDSRGVLDWYKSDLFAGSHDFKTGFNYGRARGDVSTIDRGAPGNYQLIFRSGLPFQLSAKNNPASGHSRLDYLGLFVQDRWTVGRRLTLNLGLRYAHDHAWIPEQCREAAPAPFAGLYPAECFDEFSYKSWNPVVPRLHAAYDLTGDGKTVIKGGWGRFANMRTQDELDVANKNANLTTLYRWHDLNNDKLYQPGEVDLNVNGLDFVQTQLAITASLSGMVPNPDQKEPGSDELSVSLERQLLPNFGVRATAVYSRNFNTVRIVNPLRPYSAYNIPITNPDPGPDGRVGSADDPGTSVTYYDYPASLAGAAFQAATFVNDSRADASYKSFEFAASKRMADRWQLLASYSATRQHVPYVPDIVGDQRAVAMTSLTPNAEIFAADNTWEWSTQFSGSYQFPWDLQMSANYVNQSGAPWARTVSFTGGRQVPSITLRVEPIGAQRLPSINLLTLRGEKAFRFRGGQKVSLQVQVYNALNQNFITSPNGRTLNFTQLSGVNYLKPTGIANPRIGEFAVTYAF